MENTKTKDTDYQWQVVLNRLTPEKRQLAENLLAKQFSRKRRLRVAALSGVDRVVYRASQAQQQFFVLHHKTKLQTAYNMPFGFLVDRDVTEEQLEDALDGVVERHPALRTRFEVEHGNILQIVEHSAPIEIEVESISEMCASAFISFIRPFNLGRAPLLRCKLFTAPPPQRNVLLLDLHHIIADDWSVGIILEDLNALMLGREPIAPDGHPSDLSEWEQMNYLKSSRYLQDLAFWKRYLESRPGRIEPIEQGDNESGDCRSIVAVTWLAADAQLIREFCIAQKTTRFSVMICALNVAIHQLTGVVDVVIGTVATLRDLGDFGRTVGCFVNDVLIRSRFEPGMALNDAWLRVRRSIQDALAHKACPFGHVLAAAAPNGEAIHNVIYTETLEGSDVGEAPVTRWRNSADKGPTSFDLYVTCEDLQGEMTVSFFARTAWIGHAGLVTLKNSFETVVNSLMAGSSISI